MFSSKIEVPVNEYKELLKAKGQLESITEYIKSEGYKSTEIIAMILGVKEGRRESESV